MTNISPLSRGLMLCVVIALASTFVADHYGGPTLLYALLFGMALHFLSDHSACREGIEFTARTILRIGVALLGARITVEQITALGLTPLLLVVATVSLLIIGGGVFARALGLNRELGLLTGGAVAICGASAALALSSVMPKTARSERDLIFTVVGVTSLSTIAMIVYPLIASALNLDNTTAGIFLGATIHDVAQVVGAGYMLSEQTGETSTIIKLVRVAMLVPVVVIFTLIYRKQTLEANASTWRRYLTLLPTFLLGFIGLVTINSLGWIAQPVTDALTQVSRWCLVAAIAALGLKTSLEKLAEVGWKPVILMSVETFVLLGVVLAVITAAAQF